MPRLSKHKKQFEAVSHELSGLKNRLKALNDEIEKYESGINNFREDESGNGFTAPTVDLKEWLKECNDRIVEVKEPIPSAIFYTKVVLECLNDGPISDRDLKALVVEMCRPLGIKCTNKGTISGLGIDLNILCGVLLCLGIADSTTIAATTGGDAGGNPAATADVSSDAGVTGGGGGGGGGGDGRDALTGESSASAKKESSGSGELGRGGEGGVLRNYRVEVATRVLEANQMSKEGLISGSGTDANEISSAEVIVREAMEKLQSLDDFNSILYHELSLLTNTSASTLVRKILVSWGKQLERYYSDSRKTILRTGLGWSELPSKTTSDRPVSEKKQKAGPTVPSASGAKAGSAQQAAGDDVAVTVSSSVVMPEADQDGVVSTLAASAEANQGVSSTEEKPATPVTGVSGSAKRNPPQKGWKLATGASAVADYEVQLQQWMHACYEEAAAKEMEETVVRRLAAQCGIVLENYAYRHGTRYLLDGLRLTAEGLVVSHSSSSRERNLREGAHYSSSELWDKARRRFQRTHPGVSAKHSMPLNHPYHQSGGNISEHFNYDSQALQLFNARRAETQSHSRGGGNGGASGGSSAGGGKSKGKSSSWNDPNQTQPSGSGYINPRYSLPVGWNRTDTVNSVDETMQLQEPLYASSNQVAYPSVGTVILPDMMLLTSEIPWSMISEEFQVMNAEDIDMSRDAEKSPRMSGRSNSRGSFDFPQLSGRTLSGVSVASNGSGDNVASSTGSHDDLQAAGPGASTPSSQKSSKKRVRSNRPPNSVDNIASNTPLKKLNVECSEQTSGYKSTLKSQGSLGLSHQALKEVEVSVAGFRPASFDVQLETVKLMESNVPIGDERPHKYIKIVPADGMTTGGGNSNSFASAAEGQGPPVQAWPARDQGRSENQTSAQEGLGRDEGVQQAAQISAEVVTSVSDVTNSAIETVTGDLLRAAADNTEAGIPSAAEPQADPWAKFSPPYDVDDLSDEAVNYRHEYGLLSIRTRWMKLAKLKKERKMSLAGDYPGSPRSGLTSAAGSPRASWSGGRNNKRKYSGSRGSRPNSGVVRTVPAATLLNTVTSPKSPSGTDAIPVGFFVAGPEGVSESQSADAAHINALKLRDDLNDSGVGKNI